MLDFLKRLVGRLTGRRDEPRAARTHIYPPAPSERDLPVDAFLVRLKLGRGFFTRRLSPRTREARVARLRPDERQLARARGWLS